MNRFMAAAGILIALAIVSCPLPPNGENTSLIDSVIYRDVREKSTSWTVMYYSDGDNNLESALLEDMEEISRGMESTGLINVIVLFDRAPGYTEDSSVLGSNFTDTRLFRIGADDIYPLDGGAYFENIGKGVSGEYNMGDARTLRTFIEYCKDIYPAQNYALFLSNHGSGVWPAASYLSTQKGIADYGFQVKTDDRGISFDDTSVGDAIYIGEMTDVLDSRHSVDLLVYDACVMGLVEIAYEYRPLGINDKTSGFSADYMAASTPNVWNDGLPYDLIFQRFSRSKAGDLTGYSSPVTGGGPAPVYYDPDVLTPAEFGQVIVEEQERDTQQIALPYYEALTPTSQISEIINLLKRQSFALYDLSKVGTVVDALDAAASGLTITDLDNLQSSVISYEESPIIAYPLNDLYDFGDDLGTALGTTLADAVDSMVVASFAGSSFSGFSYAQNGLGLFFPDGDTDSNYKDDEGNYIKYWNLQWWYTGVDVNQWWPGHVYGNLDFCRTDGDGTVGGYFELLQSIYNPYDPQNPAEQTSYDNYHPGRY